MLDLESKANKMHVLTDPLLFPVVRYVYANHPSKYSEMEKYFGMKYTTLRKRMNRLICMGLILKLEGYYVLTDLGYQLYKAVEHLHCSN